MKNKLMTAALGAEAALCVLFSALGGSADAVLSFPLAPMGGWLRRLSLSGSVGNGAATIIYVLVCLIPAALFLFRRMKGKWYPEDLLLLAASAALFYSLYLLINPALAEAQVHGGMSMGIGYGLSEELKFDEKTGKPLNNNLLDYKLSTIMDHPHLEAQFIQNAEPTSAFGTKALGEPPACSPAPAIRNAIYQATGVAIDQAPITPHILFAKFTEAGLIQD